MSNSVVTVQCAFCAKNAKVFVPTLPCDLTDLKTWIIAAVKYMDAVMLTRSKNLNIISVHAMSPVVHTSNIYICKKKNLFQFSCGC